MNFKHFAFPYYVLPCLLMPVALTSAQSPPGDTGFKPSKPKGYTILSVMRTANFAQKNGSHVFLWRLLHCCEFRRTNFAANLSIAQDPFFCANLLLRTKWITLFYTRVTTLLRISHANLLKSNTYSCELRVVKLYNIVCYPFIVHNFEYKP